MHTSVFAYRQTDRHGRLHSPDVAHEVPDEQTDPDRPTGWLAITEPDRGRADLSIHLDAETAERIADAATALADTLRTQAHERTRRTLYGRTLADVRTAWQNGAGVSTDDLLRALSNQDRAAMHVAAMHIAERLSIDHGAALDRLAPDILDGCTINEAAARLVEPAPGTPAR